MKKLLFALALTACAASPGLATDFTKPILDLKGQPVTTDGKKDSPPVTAAEVSVNALLASYPDETSLAGTEKARRFQIALKIQDSGAKDPGLLPDDVAMIDKLVAKLYGPLVVGRMRELLAVKP